MVSLSQLVNAGSVEMNISWQKHLNLFLYLFQPQILVDSRYVLIFFLWMKNLQKITFFSVLVVKEEYSWISIIAAMPCTSSKAFFTGWHSSCQTSLSFCKFSLLGLDMKPYVSNIASMLYDCVAVCSHHGRNLNSGHYTAFTHLSCSCFFFCDDEKRPSQVDAARVTSDEECKAANILFYVRRW